MKTYIHQQFYNTLLSFKHINSILIAISGGQDSVCLIKLIEDFFNIYNNNLIQKVEYIYIDHQWKKDSKYQIQHLINHLNEKYHNLSIYQIKKVAFTELEARHLRYQIIINHAKKHAFPTIMTAHTNTDKIETFFQKLIRGTSIDGATSLNAHRIISKDLQIIRPMIRITRMDISWFCRKFLLPTWSDKTNYQYNINRNRIRYELIPYLKQYYMLNVENNINHFIYSSSLDNDYIKQNTIKLYILSRHSLNIAIHYRLIQHQHLAIQTRALQIFFYHNFNYILNKRNLHKLLDIINNNTENLYIIYWHNLTINICNTWIYIT